MAMVNKGWSGRIGKTGEGKKETKGNIWWKESGQNGKVLESECMMNKNGSGTRRSERKGFLEKSGSSDGRKSIGE